MTIDLQQSAGPLPDRSAAVEVHLHPEAELLAPALVSALSSAAGSALKILDDQPRDEPFLYERAPVPVRAADGRASLVSFLPSSLAEVPYPEVTAWRRETRELVPLVVDRGALVCAGERLLVSDEVLEQNQRLPDDKDGEALRALGWRPRSLEVVKALLAEGLRRPRRDFVFLPAMPGDAGAHVSSWLLALDDALLVPEIDQAAFDAIGLAHELALGRLLQTFLDVQAAELEQKGFVIERLPMMPPTDLVRAQHRGESWIGRCSSPTSGVLLELGGKRTAILPRPSAEGFPERYGVVLEHALEVWRARFQRAGYEVSFVDDGATKQRGGCLRQLVASFPAP